MKKIEDKNFTDKLNSLPSEARLYYSTELSGKAIINLSKKYKQNEDSIYSLVFLLVNSGFDLNLIKERVKSMNLTGISAKNFWIDFLGLLVLPIEIYLKDVLSSSSQITDELKLLKVDKNKFDNQSKEFQNIIEDKNLETLEKSVEEFEKSVDPKSEKEYVIDIIKNSLLEVLSTESFRANLSLNRGLIYLLFNVENFQEDLVSILRSNQSLIGRENIKTDEREIAPTVANWIRVFIKEEGSDMFNDLTLAKYLDKSENAKNLDSKHKKLLNSLLIFYKNINFFPESMSNVLPENWQMFPFEIEKEEKFEDVLVDRKENKSEVIVIEDVIDIDETQKIEKELIKNEKNNNEEIKDKNINGKEVVNKEVDKKENNILALKEELKKYESLSLEYKAISSEIKRLEQKK